MCQTHTFLASQTSTKSPTTTKSSGRMQAEKHRSALPGQAGSGPGVRPGKALETAQPPAEGTHRGA